MAHLIMWLKKEVLQTVFLNYHVLNNGGGEIVSGGPESSFSYVSYGRRAGAFHFEDTPVNSAGGSICSRTGTIIN